MFQILKQNPVAAVFAVLMHLVIILFLVIGVDWLEKPEQPASQVEVVQARVVDAAKIDAEVQKLKQAEVQQQARKAATQRKEEQRLAELKRKQEQEKKRIAELERKREQEQARLAKAEQERQEAEAKQKAEAEKRRKAEEEKKRLAAAEAKKREAEEAKRKAAEAQQRREAELQAQVEAERNAGEVARYMGAIRDKVTRTWLRPAGIGSGLKCTLSIRMAPGGAVLAATVLQSSGNEAFDRSAVAAVLKADPLPVPDGNLFEQFRDIHFDFHPEEG
jgi:colicin import membrane protein